MASPAAPKYPYSAHARYLPGYPEGGPWKISVFNIGFETFPPGFKEYPHPRDKKLHPAPYFYVWEHGRVLEEYHILLVEEGAGSLETKTAGRRLLRAGDAFLLFPGEWHRYRPSRETGWKCWWAGVRGEQALNLMGALFSPTHPVIPLRAPRKAVPIFREMETLLDGDPEANQGRVAVLVSALIDDVHRCARFRPDNTRGDRIAEAKLVLLARSQENVDLGKLAADLGMGYSTFRREFKAATGMPPLRYLLAIRTNRAKALLTESDRTATDIAAATGFASAAYFIRYFKRATGLTPLVFRKAATQRHFQHGR